MKKNTLLFIGIGAAALAGYFLLKKGQPGTSAEAEAEGEGPAGEKTDAVVKAPQGKFFEALDKAKEVASTIKDAVVEVRAGNKTAKVRSGAKKKRKKYKYTKEQIKQYCTNYAAGNKKDYRKCLRTAKYKPSLPIAEQTETL